MCFFFFLYPLPFSTLVLYHNEHSQNPIFTMAELVVGDLSGWMLYNKVLLLAVLTNLLDCIFKDFFYTSGVKVVMKYNEGLYQFISQLGYGESFR